MILKNFYADIYLKNILELTPELMRTHGLRGLILDIDNTLIGHNVPLPDKKVLEHLRRLENAGIKLCVVSNNHKERVSSFCEKIGVDFFVFDALKPKKRGYIEAVRLMELPAESIGAVGDQVFTDVWGAKRAGCCAILTVPLHRGGEGFFIALKRILEKPFLKKQKKKENKS